VVKIERYKNEDKNEWNEFVKKSKNANFLFYRDYMEYHSERFNDFSLLFYENEKLIGLLPANITDEILVSHGGLTYGGIISDNKMTTTKMLEIFEVLKEYLISQRIKKLKYKAIPHIYHTIPAEEDIYALFINNAKLVKSDVSTSIFSKEKLKFNELRKRGVNKAIKNGLIVRQNIDFNSYMEIVEKVLSAKYKTKPVHTSDEMKLLTEHFPENIKLFASFKEENMLAGVIIYESKNVAHSQYIACLDEGKDIGALDLVFDYLVNDYYKDKKIFDFGISTEKDGRYLNTGLISQKEMFGARAIIYNTYEITLN